MCFCNQVTLQNQTMPFLFFSSVVSSLSSSFLLSSLPSLLCLPSPPCLMQPTLRTFYSVQNINLSSRGVITLSSRAAAALFKCCLFFFSSICFHFTSLPQYLLPPFLFFPAGFHQLIFLWKPSSPLFFLHLFFFFSPHSFLKVYALSSSVTHTC